MEKGVENKKTSNYSEPLEPLCEDSELQKYDRKLIRGLMRGFGTTMILWMISKERQHGYEIMSKLSEMYFDIQTKKKMPSPSIIYPVLHELEQKGLIMGEWDSHGKRKVKYYEITEEGNATLIRIKNIFRKHTHQLIDDFWADMFFRKQKEEE
jgi:DNA-binding PadR family transcriptional regulator